jgi:hypothetical protein
MAGAITLLQATSASGTDADTYTFEDENLGTESADRYIAIVVHARDSGATAKTIDTVTVAGISASEIVQAQGTGGTNSDLCGIFLAPVPTGTAGDVVVTFSEAVLRCAVAAFSLTGINPTAHDTNSSTATNPSAEIDVPADGVALGGGTAGSSGTSTWTAGLTERYDNSGIAGELGTWTGASDAFDTIQTGLTITIDFVSATDPVGVFASFGPAVAPPAGGAPPGWGPLLAFQRNRLVHV